MNTVDKMRYAVEIDLGGTFVKFSLKSEKRVIMLDDGLSIRIGSAFDYVIPESAVYADIVAVVLGNNAGCLGAVSLLFRNINY